MVKHSRILVNAWVWTAVVVLFSTACVHGVDALDATRFSQHVNALTSAKHRVAGTVEGTEAGDYILRQLRSMSDDVRVQSFSFPQEIVETCEIRSDGGVAPLLPFAANGMQPSVTPQAGLSGNIVYLGRLRIAIGDVLDWPRLIKHVVAQAKQDSASPGKQVWALLDSELRHELEAASEVGAVSGALQSRFIDAINQHVLGSKSLFSPEAWQNVRMTERDTFLIRKRSSGLSAYEWLELNRNLLTVAYPEAITQGTQGRDLSGCIAVMDFDHCNNFARAFELGAKAVVFVRWDGDIANRSGQGHSGVSANMPRFYLSEADALATKLLTRQTCTVVSRVRWEKRTGRNLFLLIEGSRPVFHFDNDEFVVLSAHYDTDGVVPRNALGYEPAANCAALLETARMLAGKPGRRSVLIAFFDNHANFMQGGRRFYAALRRGIPERIDDPLPVRRQDLVDEQTMINEYADVLAGGNIITGAHPLRKKTLIRLGEYAKSRYNTYMKQLSDVRIAIHALKISKDPSDFGETLASLEDEKTSLLEQKTVWQVVRECIRDEKPMPATNELANTYFVAVCAGVLKQQEDRLQQIEEDLQVLDQEASLIKLLNGATPVCHVDYHFSVGDTHWLVVPHLLVEHGRRYGELLDNASAAMRKITDNGFVWESEATWDSDGSSPQNYTIQFEEGESSFADVFQIPAITLVTELDRRLSAHKPDLRIPEPMWDRIRVQSSDFLPLLKQALDDPCMSVPNTGLKKANFIIEEPIWKGDGPVGHSVRSFGYGDTVASSDELNALVHIFPGSGDRFQKDYFVYADANGRFSLVPVSKNGWSSIQIEACRFDGDGVISAISTVNPKGGTAAVDPGWYLAGIWKAKAYSGHYTQVNVFEGVVGTFAGRSRPLSGPFTFKGFKLLDGSSDSLFKLQHLRYDSSMGLGMYQVVRPRGIKLIYEDGRNPYDVLLYLNAGDTAAKPWIGYGPGNGQYLGDGPFMLPLESKMGMDIFSLNESRLAKLRSKNIYLNHAEYLHSNSKYTLDLRQAAVAVNDHKHATVYAAVAAATEGRVYRPVVATTDDLVSAVTILLLLAIPFAFSLQSLLLASYNVYRQIAGFGFFFALSFAVLSYTHPAFAFSTTPTVIILAFIIMLMSGTVIWVVGQKFNYEIKKMQGLVAAAHTFEKSLFGNVSAAVSLAISIMKRRPARTTLTVATVLLLTFTILSFVAFQTEKEVNTFRMGPADDQVSRLMIHDRAWKTLGASVEAWRGYVETYFGDSVVMQGRYWLVPDLTLQEGSPEYYIPIRNETGKRAIAGSIMTISMPEFTRISDIRSILPPGSLDKLADGTGVCLSKSIADALQAKPGDRISIKGQSFECLGVFSSENILNMRQIDGSPYLPVDFQGTRMSMGALGSTGSAGGGEDPMGDLENELAQLEPEALDPVDPESLIIVGPTAAPALGLALKSIVMFPDETLVDIEKLAHALPILNPDGVYMNRGGERTRYFYGDRYSVSGSSAVALPLILGGLIIFSTMLGSIIDREKEIYTFSALGLAPRNIAMLFFVEAGIYAVIGGFGGYLCSQVVARLLDIVAQYGIFEAPEMNYSSSTVINTILLVMATVLVSTIYPAFKAASKATAQTTGHWVLPPATSDTLEFDFPFTISQFDITGIMCFLREHFVNHADRTVGEFAADQLTLFRDTEHQSAALKACIWLQPFDQGISQLFTVTARPSDIDEVCEIHVVLQRMSGPVSAWKRSYRQFLDNLRSQFLLWRTLDDDSREHYLTLADQEDARMNT